MTAAGNGIVSATPGIANAGRRILQHNPKLGSDRPGNTARLTPPGSDGSPGSGGGTRQGILLLLRHVVEQRVPTRIQLRIVPNDLVGRIAKQLGRTCSAARVPDMGPHRDGGLRMPRSGELDGAADVRDVLAAGVALVVLLDAHEMLVLLAQAVETVPNATMIAASVPDALVSAAPAAPVLPLDRALPAAPSCAASAVIADAMGVATTA